MMTQTDGMLEVENRGNRNNTFWKSTHSLGWLDYITSFPCSNKHFLFLHPVWNVYAQPLIETIRRVVSPGDKFAGV
jgi:hypothetical protein